MLVRPIETDADWAAARRIRTRVFIEEQACPPEEEWDAHDETSARGATCHHLLGFVDGTPVAVARWRPVTHDGERMAKLERFAVLPEWRGRGLGRAIVDATIADAQSAGFAAFVLHAQAHLEALYASRGFEPVGGMFEEAGIPHVLMIRRDGTE
jgi:predicted GNAT family N-acyltransferase